MWPGSSVAPSASSAVVGTPARAQPRQLASDPRGVMGPAYSVKTERGVARESRAKSRSYMASKSAAEASP